MPGNKKAELLPGANPTSEDDQHPLPREGGRLVWTPEDTANFLSAAIKESQRPLVQAIQRQGVPRSTVALFALLLAAAGGGFWQLFSNMLERQEQGWRERQQRLNQTIQEFKQESETGRQQRQELQAKFSQATEARVLSQSRLEALRETTAVWRREKADLTARWEAWRAEMATDRRVATAKLESRHEENRNILAQSAVQEATVKRLRGELAAVRREAGTGQARYREQRREAAAARLRLKLLELQLRGLKEEKEALAKQLQAMRELLRVHPVDGTRPADGARHKPLPQTTPRDQEPPPPEAENRPPPDKELPPLNFPRKPKPPSPGSAPAGFSNEP